MSYYFDDITNSTKININNILLNKKLYENNNNNNNNLICD